MQSSYFLGANTPYGFYSLFNELYDPQDEWNMYIIKGGPGTGKSTLMKAVADVALKLDLNVDKIPCSSDPESLDGVIIPELKVSVCDGTSPHIVEPIYPGVCEHLVNLSECWDTDKLKENTSKIKMISMTCSKAHQKCIKYLKTVKLIDDEINQIIYPLINFEKIERFTERLIELKKLPPKNQKDKIRLLSAVTPMGVTVNYDTFINGCKKIIIIKDNYNISQYITASLIKDKNANLIKYNCPLSPKTKTEHIIFTDVKIGVFTSNNFHSINSEIYKTISTERFIDKNMLINHKTALAFLNKSKKEMIDEAVKSLQIAKSAHDILESYYIEAMDYNKVNDIKEKLIKTVFDNVSRET